ncbi:MAG: alpha/beta hydrolase [Solirubrobacterales bacterium]|nr:alpha/beta hydrolase [Solirubrobacterales bacterium]
MLFENFDVADVPTPRGHIHARVGGSGQPLLLLHGFPETHLMWHAVAPVLIEQFTVVVADLPGYGQSFRPSVSDEHSAHSKRALAGDLLAAMGELGHARFAVAGHDRGGRVAYRMALDHPASVSRLAVLDIVPTGEIWLRADAAFAIGYWHWSFLAQPAPLPEEMILGNPDAFWLAAQRLGLKDDARYPQEVLNAYRAQCADPATVEAICEDYRAGATIDRQLDDADRGRRTIACPVLALWGSNGALPRFYDDPLALWRAYAPQITGRAVENASHFLVEDVPRVVAEELIGFFG